MDDTTNMNIKYYAILAGKLSDPSKKKPIYLKVTNGNINSKLLKLYVKKALNSIDCQLNQDKLIITDGASYNKKVQKGFENKYSDKIWIAFYSHFLNNCADFVKSNYSVV